MPLLDESLAISSELGMRPLMERVLSRRGDTEGINEGPQASPGALMELPPWHGGLLLPTPFPIRRLVAPPDILASAVSLELPLVLPAVMLR